MNKVQQVLATREGGSVIRSHTLQYLGTYNVAMHSYNALSMLLVLYPGTPSIELIKTVLWHDVEERWTGDIPTPLKWLSPKVKELLTEICVRLDKEIGLLPENITKEEESWLHAVDMLEFYVWLNEQTAMGNTLLNEVLYKVMNTLGKMEMPKEARQFYLELNGMTYIRTPEIDDLLGGNI